jgi:uncharacterized protein (DUF1778 family)
MSDMKEERITIRLDEQEHFLLHSLAKRENKTESEIVCAALRMYVKEVFAQQSCYDFARELGIIGVTEELPSDLSTNKDYFERFGE